MTQARLIKRTEATTKPAHRQSSLASARVIVKEWLSQYQETKPRNARVTFAALFIEPQRG